MLCNVMGLVKYFAGQGMGEMLSSISWDRCNALGCIIGWVECSEVSWDGRNAPQFIMGWVEFSEVYHGVK